MKKHLRLIKTLLVAAGLLTGATSAWADDVEKHILYSQDYENATTSDWASFNGSVGLATGDAIYGNYATCTYTGTGNRDFFCFAPLIFPASSGYTTADMNTVGYCVEFDVRLCSGNKSGNSKSQFFVTTAAGPVSTGNAAYTGTDYVFSLSQPTLTSDSRNTTWYINDLTESTGSTVTLSYDHWFHVKLVVSGSSVAYTIKNNNNGTDVASGSKTVDALPTITGFFTLAGRGAGFTHFDNLEVYNYTTTWPEMETKWSQSFYAIAIQTGGTLTKSAETAFGDYYSTTELHSDFGVSSANWGLRKNNGTTTGLWLYNSTSTFAVNNVSRGDIIVFTSSGSITANSNVKKIDALSNYAFQVLDDGIAVFNYTSQSSYVRHIAVYSPVNEIVGAIDNSTTDRGATHDLATLSDGDVYKVTFQNHGSSGANKNNFLAYVKNSSSTIVATMYSDWYDYVNNRNTDFTSPYATSMDGGLTQPASCWTNYFTDMADCPVELTFSYSDGTLRIAGTATKDNHIYYYNYAYRGLEGDVTVGLSVCAAWLEVLSTSSSAAVSGTIASKGYSTIAVPYALDLSSATGIDAAYVATKTTTEVVNLKSVETAVPAGTPLILKGTGGAAYSIPVVATGTAPETNYLSAAVVPTGIAANAAYILQNALFHQVTAASTVPAGKAYLLASNVPAGARALSFTFDDGEDTGISQIENGKLKMEDVVFSLSGQRVSQPAKGMYIVNGKKVIIK